MNTNKSSYLHNFTKNIIFSLDLHQNFKVMSKVLNASMKDNSNASHSIKYKDFPIFQKFVATIYVPLSSDTCG